MPITPADYLIMLAREAARRRLFTPSPEAVKVEADLHEQILDYCRSHGWIDYHGSMAHRTKRTPGEPDHSIRADRGRVFDIECKSATGKLRTDQAGIIMQSAKLGHTVYVISSFQEFLDLVNQPKLLPS